MKCIHKYKLAFPGWSTIEMPSGALVISAQYQHETLMIWAVVVPERPAEIRRFFVSATGLNLPETAGKFVGTEGCCRNGTDGSR